MAYAFSFGFDSNIGYPIDFYTRLNNIYSIYFWGFELAEIIRCTLKSVELSPIEKRSVVTKLALASEVCSRCNVINKVEGVANIDLFDMKLVSDVIIPSKKVISILVDSLMETGRLSLKNADRGVDSIFKTESLHSVEPDLVKEVYNKTMQIIAELVNSANVKSIWKSIEKVTLVGKNDLKCVEPVITDTIIRPLSFKNVTVCTEGCYPNDIKMVLGGQDYNVYKAAYKGIIPNHVMKKLNYKCINTVTGIKKYRLKSISDATLINKRTRIYIDAAIQLSKSTMSKVENIDLRDMLKRYREMIEPLHLESLKLNQRATVQSSKLEVCNTTRRIYSDIIKEIINNSKTANAENGVLEVGDDGHHRDVVAGLAEIMFEHYRYVDAVGKEVIKPNTDRCVETPSNEIASYINKLVTPTASVDKLDMHSVEQVNEVDDHHVSFTEVTTEIDSKKYKSIRFGKRWRFKTGEAFDKIWINPEESQLTVMANIRTDIINGFITTMNKQVKDDVSNGFSSSAQYRPMYTAKQLSQNTNLTDFMAQEMITISTDFIAKYEAAVEGLSLTLDEILNTVTSVLNAVKSTYYARYITPYTEPKTLAVEAHISFKAMLDFILFVEQLIMNNRFFYAASRAVTAIDDMRHLIDDWLSEQRPEEGLPNEYDYLRRWFSWWADGYKGKHINDMELNGLTVLEQVKNEMVNYFEGRWGKRVVEYGVDGMYIYSKDYSYIDRIRGKKHGYAHRPVDLRRMSDEYGINEFSLPYNMEQDT